MVLSLTNIEPVYQFVKSEFFKDLSLGDEYGFQKGEATLRTILSSYPIPEPVLLL